MLRVQPPGRRDLYYPVTTDRDIPVEPRVAGPIDDLRPANQHIDTSHVSLPPMSNSRRQCNERWEIWEPLPGRGDGRSLALPDARGVHAGRGCGHRPYR